MKFVRVSAGLLRNTRKETSNDSGSHVMRTYCGRMLKFIRCVRNKLAGSSDVGFGDDRRTDV